MKKLSEGAVIKTILIEETWRKIKGRVYYYHRLQGNRKWTRELTSYKDLPYIKINWGDRVNNQ